jgi:hypothetical protein
MDVLDLEAKINGLPGVLGCVILSGDDGLPSEIQAFSHMAADRDDIRRRIESEARALDLHRSLRRVLVFELGTESISGDHDALRKAELLAELEALGDEPTADESSPPLPGRTRAGDELRRPVIRKVDARPSTEQARAEVFLQDSVGQAVGEASGRDTSHGLRITAEATLGAVHKLIAVEGAFRLAGAWLTEAGGRSIVLVAVGSNVGELIGAALVRNGPPTEAAVRATLDAVNRRLARPS